MSAQEDASVCRCGFALCAVVDEARLGAVHMIVMRGEFGVTLNCDLTGGTAASSRHAMRCKAGRNSKRLLSSVGSSACIG
jgi:hypothetical protein